MMPLHVLVALCMKFGVGDLPALLAIIFGVAIGLKLTDLLGRDEFDIFTKCAFAIGSSFSMSFFVWGEIQYLTEYSDSEQFGIFALIGLGLVLLVRKAKLVYDA